jgi:hypothetical protein
MQSTTQKMLTPIALFDEVDDRVATFDDEPANNTMIPDALTIKHIKEQRKRKREQDDSTEADFIPLDENAGKIVLASESRLVREEDDSDSDQEQQTEFDDLKGNRISFGKPVGDMKQSVRERIKQDDMMDDMVDDSHEDDEDQQWELLQLKSAGVVPPPPLPKSIVVDDDDDILAKRVKKQDLMIDDEEIQSLALSFEQLDKNLKNSYHALESSYKEDCQQLEQTQTQMQERAQHQSFFKQELDDLSEKYTFYQEMKAYIEDLVDCLDTKVPEIEALQDKLLQEREQYYDQMYQNWVQDQLHQSNRSSSLQEWWLVDYSNKQQQQQHDQDVQSIIEEASTIFDDVNEEFCSLAKIRSRFESWKYSQPESYKETYCGLCAQKVFAPFVRLEIMTNQIQQWYDNPLARPTFVDFEWWKELLYYGVSQQVDDDQDDDHIVPELIKKVITPMILHTITHIYNPLSYQQNHALHQLLDEYVDYVQQDQIKQVFETIMQRLKQFIRDLKRPSGDASHEIVHKQFYSSVQLLQSIVSWNDTFSLKQVFEWNASVRSLIEQEMMPVLSYLLKHPTTSQQERNQWLEQVPGSCRLMLR